MGPGALADPARVRAVTGVAPMSVAEFGEEEARAVQAWLRAWVRRYRSPALRAWLRAEHPGLPPEVVTRTASGAGPALDLVAVDVAVLVVALGEGWDDEWTVAVMEAGLGAGEALALRAREDGWEVLRTVLALTGGGGPGGGRRG